MHREYSEFKALVEDRLLEYLPYGGEESEKLYSAMRYSLEGGGKRLRPVLLLAAMELSGADLREGLPFAIAMEYIHTYSLIHDDLPAMDDDDMRRGRATNHKVFGEGIAILAGDGLLSSAFQLMAESMEEERDDEKLRRKVGAFKAIAEGAGAQGMVAGQTADLENEKGNPGDEVLEFIHENKTGKLITAAIMAGLALGGAGEELTEKMMGYGRNLGLAFQIADDILDVVGSENSLGKDVGSDREKDKITFVSRFGLEGARERLMTTTGNAVDYLDGMGEEGDFFRKLAWDMAERTN